MLQEIFAVGEELGIGARTELVEVQSLALSLGRHAQRHHPAQQPVQTVRER